MRFIYLDCSLIRTAGHHYNFCKRIIGMAEEANIPVKILANSSLETDLIEELNAVPYFRYHAYWTASKLGSMRSALTAMETVRQATLEELMGISGIRSDDIIYVNSVLPAQLLALNQWAQSMGPDAPTIIAEVFFKTSVTFNEQTYTEHSNDIMDNLWLYIGDILPKPEQLNFNLISFDPKVSDIYSRILRQPVFTLTNPLSILSPPQNRTGKKIITVGLGGHQRYQKGYHHMVGILCNFLQETGWDNVRFRLHHSFPDEMHDVQQALRELTQLDQRIELVEGPLTVDEWNAFIDSLDIVLCPYEPIAYKGSWSGLVREALSCGSPVIVPRDSVSADFLSKKHVLFEDFAEWTVSDIFEALKKIVNDYDRYASSTYKAAKLLYENEHEANIVKEIIEKFI